MHITSLVPQVLVRSLNVLPPVGVFRRRLQVPPLAPLGSLLRRRLRSPEVPPHHREQHVEAADNLVEHVHHGEEHRGGRPQEERALVYSFVEEL